MQGRDLKKKEKVMEKEKAYVGIDVAKARMEGGVHQSKELRSFTNDDRGIVRAVSCLRETAPALVVVEATGGIEMPLVAALGAARLPIVVVNPRPKKGVG